uniref:Uncharacterized protein n=1 Tax=Rhipicephalus zambeziensis TaxID=60191 RepID=A0A224YCZ9_9ACAR
MHAFPRDLASTYLFRVVAQETLRRRNSSAACLHIKRQDKSLKGALQHFISMVRKWCQSLVEAPENTRAKYYTVARGLKFTIYSQCWLESIPSSLSKWCRKPEDHTISPKSTAIG